MTSLWSFTGGVDGANPHAAIVQGNDGNFYGTTSAGGANTNYCSLGCGTVFRISPSGSLTNLHSFAGLPDGSSPGSAALFQASDGNFYGTVPYGGASNWGTIFRVTPSGGFSALWSFTGGTNQGRPQAAFIQGNDGYLYSTTSEGGSLGDSDIAAYGTVFRMSLPQSLR